jgi:osmoprotectant transport system permease protein
VSIVDAFRWLWTTTRYGGPNGIDTRTLAHLWISVRVLFVASVVAIPIGYLIGHTGKGDRIVVAVSGSVRALPTLGLLSLLALQLGIGLRAPFIALVVLAIPPILAGAYSGFRAIDRSTVSAARAVGMTEMQIVRKVEVPLGLGLLVGGIRSASLQVIATATLADYVGGGGLGRFICAGLKTNDFAQMLGGSLLVIGLAILSEVLFAASDQNSWTVTEAFRQEDQTDRHIVAKERHWTTRCGKKCRTRDETLWPKGPCRKVRYQDHRLHCG